MGSSLRRFRAAALMVGLFTPLVGCTSEEPAPPIAVTTPPPSTRGVILNLSITDFESGRWFQVPIQVSSRGKLDITVNWTFPDTWMYVYFSNSACSYAELAGGTCRFLIVSETMDPKPRVLYTDLLDPQTYYLTLYNVPRDPRKGVGSDNTETVAIQIGLTIPFRESSEGRTPVQPDVPTVVSPPGP
jgi:hypothetical protein